VIVPIICHEPDCTNNGEVVNEVSGLNPQQLDDFYEGYDESCPEDHCPVCGKLGIAEDPLFEREWEHKYYDQVE